MKINKKIIVSSMALCMGAALAGSVSGTIAWYQYSTRSTVAMLGTSVGLSKNMQIRIGSGTADDTGADFKWSSDLRKSDIREWLNRKDEQSNFIEKCQGNLTPVTTGVLDKNSALPTDLYLNPVYQHFELSKWSKADKSEYVVIPVYVRYVEENNSGASYAEKNVYLHDVTIANGNSNSSTKLDISSAVRLNVSSQYDADTKKNANFSLNGGSINTFEKLDLNNDGLKDGPEHYEWEYTEQDADTGEYIPTPTNYGTQVKTPAEGNNPAVNYTETETVQKCYRASNSDLTKVTADDDKNMYADDDTNPEKFDSSKVAIAKTKTDGTGTLINLTIWLEGWQELPVSNATNAAKKTLWDVTNYSDSQFNVGVTFVCEL